jgi:glycosyltransferase involved in cell wall biosynthesis
LKILHLTHTDIRVDSRILKELQALSDVAAYELHAVGIAELGASASTSVLHSARVQSIRLLFRSARWLPSVLRHALIYLETWVRVLARGVAVRPQLVHCHDTPLLPIAVVIAWLCKAKVIYDAHELESDKNGQSRWMSRGTLAVEKLCWRGIDGFITVSASILRWYADRFPARASALVYNAPVFDPGQATANAPSTQGRYFHQKYGIPEDSLVIVYLGLFVPGRGVEKLLTVFTSQGVSAHIVFIGRGHLREAIERCARDNPRVHVHDAVPHDQVVSLVKNADCGVCLVEKVSLSDYYSLPNKLFEYAFAGVPVLASAFPDMRELVERFGLGTCTADDELSITRAVVRLQGEGRQRVTADLAPLGWAAQADHLRQLYQRVLHPAATAGAA